MKHHRIAIRFKNDKCRTFINVSTRKTKELMQLIEEYHGIVTFKLSEGTYQFNASEIVCVDYEVMG